MDASEIHIARFDALAPRELYGILKLRSDTFIVEQQCVYPDIDGRDMELDTLHLWIERDGAVVSSLRVLDDGDAHRISRVCTHPAHRGQGLATRLLEHVMTTIGPPFVLDSQGYLQRYYERLGFRVCGATWDDHGIVHVPMRLD